MFLTLLFVVGSFQLSQAVQSCATIVSTRQSWTTGKNVNFNIGLPSQPNGWSIAIKFDQDVSQVQFWNGVVQKVSHREFIVTHKSWNVQAQSINSDAAITYLQAGVEPQVTEIVYNGMNLCQNYATTTTPTTTTTITTTTSASTIYSCDSFVKSLGVWPTSSNINFNFSLSDQPSGWSIRVRFDKAVSSLNFWNGNVLKVNCHEFDIINKPYNRLSSQIMSDAALVYPVSEPKVVSIVYQGKSLCEGSGVSTSAASTATTPPLTTTQQTTTTTASPQPIRTCSNAQQDYNRAMELSLLFYEAQRSGYLPSDQRVTWRKDSFLGDQGNNGEDLTGGYFDAGDYVKFNFPMTGAMTVLAWGGIQHGAGYENAGQLGYLKQAVKWGANYLIKCHTGPNELYAQDSDPTYALTLLDHAISIYNFADTYRGKYSDSVADADEFYQSYGGFNDELVWGAAWLYKATGQSAYLTKAKAYYDQFELQYQASDFSWDEKTPGVMALMAEITGETQYKNDLKEFCRKIRDDTPKTNAGLVFILKWGSLRYSANAAFVCLQASNMGIDAALNKDLAISQSNYILGSSGRSFLIGYGPNYPKRPHHASSSCPPAPANCDWDNFTLDSDNYNTLNGALVGGPKDLSDTYVDDRTDYITNEVTLDYNAGFQSLMAGLSELEC
eukprot:maker-scaffold14_size734282-snap-gene-0.11 protein:Tk11273 transcript:maker-scaffold14_size734282-snap-gene-0.11-mRNA-1 annotation:"NwEG"